MNEVKAKQALDDILANDKNIQFFSAPSFHTPKHYDVNFKRNGRETFLPMVFSSPQHEPSPVDVLFHCLQTAHSVELYATSINQTEKREQWASDERGLTPTDASQEEAIIEAWYASWYLRDGLLGLLGEERYTTVKKAFLDEE